MRDRLPILAFVGALLFVALTLLLMRASSRGEFAEASSTYRSEPDGARALFLLATEAGLPVARRTVDLETLEGTPELVLLGVEGTEARTPGPKTLGLPDDRLSRYERDALLEAVDRGATLVYAVNRQEALLTSLGLELAPVPKKDRGPHRLAPFTPGPLTRDVSTFDVRIAGWLRPATAHPDAADGGVDEAPPPAASADGLPILVDLQNGDQPVALLLHRGRGRILVLSAPALASNAELAHGDTARLWLDVLAELLPAGGSIQFDEYHHGFTGERSVMGYAARYGLPWAVAQLLFALALWLLASRRLGEARSAEEEGPRLAASALGAMARIYQLGGHRTHAASALVRGATRALHGLTATTGQSSPEEVIAALEAKGHLAFAEALRALVTSAEAPALTEAELLELARRAAALRASVLSLPHASSGKEAA